MFTYKAKPPSKKYHLIFIGSRNDPKKQFHAMPNAVIHNWKTIVTENDKKKNILTNKYILESPKHPIVYSGILHSLSSISEKHIAKLA